MKKVLIGMLVCISLIGAGFLQPAFADDKQDVKWDRYGETVKEDVTVSENQNAKIVQKNINFGNGDYFWIRRYTFKNSSEKPYVSTFSIAGDTIKIRYWVMEGNEKKWIETSDISTLNTSAAKTTLFITTDKRSMIIGIPAVYKAQEDYGNLDAQVSKEKPVTITKSDGKYMIQASFVRDKNYIGEIWALQSSKPLFKMNDWDKQVFTANDMSFKWRVSMEGFYQRTYENYEPAGPNVYFRQPTCYAGGTFLRALGSNASYDLGYALMKLSAGNQNEAGYFPTPSRSSWLYKDFRIQGGFYDTRFNTDFAVNLLDAYEVYKDEEFMVRAKKYGEFYVNYAAENCYEMETGILVEDYWHETAHAKTHVSLNHHLAGMNFMLRMYYITKEQPYLDTAVKMANGVSDTESYWIMPDGNLKYAIFYEGDNLMIDYPYLTYNDLFRADSYLDRYAKMYYPAFWRMMDSKKEWMINNDVHGYFGE